ncbi:MAG: 3D domain-containing protein [Candidatus Yanofskybacteria bacterium]|nr:3D domain-containing protein [Candidatus Yanofskybacteria bacterium]
MNTKILGVIAVLALLLIPSTSAHAGVKEWIAKGESNTLTASNLTFDQIYEALNFTNTKDTETLATFQEQAVRETAVTTKTTKSVKAKQTFVVSISGYSSTPDQTDASPFITAKGTYVRDGIVAANFLPFGTAIKIPDLYGDKIFVVEDRMNSRYWYNVDVWFTSREAALQLGRRTVTIEVL